MNRTADALSFDHCRTMKAVMVANIATTMTRAVPILLREKNTGDHKKFRLNWTNHKIMAALAGARSHVLHPTMPIKTKSAIQTGANIQSGGLKDGLFKAAYHRPGTLRYPIVNPAPSVKAMNVANRRVE